MSILDDAIREHLELKRAHGADDDEVKRLEDEAFGPPQRPDEIDPFAEAPTEFLTSPEETAAALPEIADEHERSGRRPNLTDLQEPPPADAAPGPADPDQMPPPAPEDDASFFDADAEAEARPVEDEFSPAPDAPDARPVEDELSPPPDAPPPSPADAADVPLPPPPGGAPAADLAPPTGETPAPPADEAAAPLFDQELTPAEEAPAPPTDEEAAPPTDESPAPPTDEEYPAGEHEIPADAGPSAAEREAIADQPTQMFDVQAHVDAEAAAEAPPAGEQASPTDEELVDAAGEEPLAAPPAPEDAGPPTELYEQPPLESHGPDAEVAGRPPEEAEPEEGSAEFDFFNEQRLSDELDQALEAPLPPTDEHLAMPQYKDEPGGQGGIFDFESEPGEERPYEEDPSQEVLRRADEAEAAEEPAADADDDDEDETDYDPETGHEDVLEDTPQFLEDAPEDDDLWFEQKPPKDFDLD